jgi:ferredoxin--NADP+ reductase
MSVAAVWSSSLSIKSHEVCYNAEVVWIRDVHAGLRVLRVQPDGGPLKFEPGQYTVLGLGDWEPTLAKVDDMANPQQRMTASTCESSGAIIKRAYSFSSSIIDERGEVIRPGDCPFVEFYFNLVAPTSVSPRTLTPRLFRLEVGSRLFIGPRPHGNYTLQPVGPDDDVFFISTGTGEAPHNAMVAELLATGHRGRIVSVTCTRHQADFGYLSQHLHVEKLFPHYLYVTLTTREPENLEPSHPRFVGKQYVQHWFEPGEIERRLGFRIEPSRTHFFLCGSPAMIGVPRYDADGQAIYPEPTGMIETLVQLGFMPDRPGHVGRVHFEKYW